MDFFTAISEGQGIIHARGVYRQVALFERKGRVYASPVWMNIQQGNVLNRMKAAGDERHVCPLQLDVIENCLRLYSKPGDVVMDPFNGIGSTGYQAVKMGRRYLGFELKPEYADQAGKNLKDAELMYGDLFGAME